MMQLLHTPLLVFLLGASDDRLTAIVEANTSAIEQIHSIHIELELYEQISFSGGDTKPTRLERPKLVAVWAWSKQGRNERISYDDRILPLDGEGRPRNLGELVQDGTSTRGLLNWDRDNPQAITPLSQGSVRAFIAPQSPRPYGGPFPCVKAFALMELQLVSSDVPRPLALLVEESPQVILHGEETLSGHRTWKIEAAHPMPDTDVGSFEIFVDPGVNYMIRKVVCHADKLTLVREAKAFKEFGAGVWFPTDMVQETFLPEVSGATSSIHLHVPDLSVNAPLPDSEFAMGFPKDVLVQTLPPVKGRIKTQLWGVDDRPVKEINNLDDLREFAPRFTRQSFTVGRIVAVLFGVAGIIAVFAMILYRRLKPRV